MMNHIGSQRELFVDNHLVDLSLTDAPEVLHRPEKRELVFTNDAPWEGDGWVYYTIFEDEGIFRMYYLTRRMYNKELTAHDAPFRHICYATSVDGVHWHKPALGLVEFQGIRSNNILMPTDSPDAFHVFKDPNPACLPGERYKALCTRWDNGRSALWCKFSDDGVHFRDGYEIASSTNGHFDSHNTAFWDAQLGLYVCYHRGWHEKADGSGSTRDIRRMVSKDFRTWEREGALNYSRCTDDLHMYTNNIQPYFRAPQYYIGLPARYTERPEWTPNYDRLCGAAHRRWRMQFHPRYGLAVTDGMFMSSRNGLDFTRWGEAFLRPGAESRKRWTYGDGYAGYGLLATPGRVLGEDPELSLYATVNNWMNEPQQLYRYTLRMDGFVSRSGDWAGKTLVTQPFTFTGTQLSVNFSTSAAGCMRVVLTDEENHPIDGYDSGELFGDSIDRIVDFPAPVAALQSKSVRLHITLKDADLYAFRFSD